MPDTERVQGVRDALRSLLRTHDNEPCPFCGTDYRDPKAHALWHKPDCPMAYVHAAFARSVGAWAAPLCNHKDHRRDGDT